MHGIIFSYADGDHDFQLLVLRAFVGSLERRGILIVGSESDVYVAFARTLIVCRIQTPPETAGKMDLDPGMAGGGPDESLVSDRGS